MFPMSGIDLVLDTFENSYQPKANVPIPVLELMKKATNGGRDRGV
jgi:hypothetical protein